MGKKSVFPKQCRQLYCKELFSRLEVVFCHVVRLVDSMADAFAKHGVDSLFLGSFYFVILVGYNSLVLQLYFLFGCCFSFLH